MPIKNNIAERNMFISYRRDTGIDIAARVKDFFVSKGLNVFYDITSMQLGEFDKQIIQHINSSDYFVLNFLILLVKIIKKYSKAKKI